jgi:type II secretory pathway pseudopilin PulG
VPAAARRRNQHGMVLADILLAVAITGLILAASLPLLSRNADELSARAVADDLKAFKASAEEHFKANRTAYEAAMTDGTGAATLCRLGVNPADGSGGIVAASTTLHTCAIDATMLRFLKVLPAGGPTRNAYGESWVAVYRMVYRGTLPTGGVEALYASAATDGSAVAVPANARRYQTARTAAGYLGGTGGAIPDGDREVCVARRASATYQACGAAWRVNLADFVNPAELARFASRLPN